MYKKNFIFFMYLLLTGCNAQLYNKLLVVTSINPNEGSDKGGTIVQLSGNFFTANTQVSLGGATCLGVSLISTQSITCQTSAREWGLVDVRITNSHSYDVLTNGFTYLLSEISSWRFVDGGTANGINFNSAESISRPFLAAFDNKLYAAWSEWDGVISQLHVKVYNGNDDSPAWTFVDAGGLSYGNDTGYSKLVVFNNKLYAIWAEITPIGQIRVKVYNGNDSAPAWTSADGGLPLNRLAGSSASSPHAIVFNDKLYAFWMEYNGGSIFQIRAAVYNHNDPFPSWTLVDGNLADGLNKDTTVDGLDPWASVLNSKLYLHWHESNVFSQIRSVVYNGNDSAPAWTFVDGNGVTGLNYNTGNHATDPVSAVINNKLYSAWMENNGVFQIRASVYNGNDSAPAWTFVDGNGVNGINKDITRSARHPKLLSLYNKLYMTFYEDSTQNNEIRVVVYNGNDASPAWTFIDGDGPFGLNFVTNKAATVPVLASLGSKVYLGWSEDAGAEQFHIRVGIR